MDFKNFDPKSLIPSAPAFMPPQVPVLAPPLNSNLASEFHRRLLEWVNEFNAAIDQEHDVGVQLVSFGPKAVFRITDITYWNPSLIGFIGIAEDGSPVELIQHVTQINVLLTKLPRKDLSKPKQPIGFTPESQAGNPTQE